MIKFPISARKVLPVTISALLGSLYLGEVYGNDIDINNQTIISESHPDDSYTVFENGQLTMSSGTILGSPANPPETLIVNASDTAQVIINSGSVISGSMGFGDKSQLLMGVGGSNQITQTGSVILADDANGSFDNVSITSHGPFSALDLRGNAQATLSAHSVIQSSGDAGADAISLVDNAHITVNGSTIKGEASGFGLYGNGSVTANGASITGNINGAYVTGNGHLTVNGGNVTSLKGGVNTTINQGQYGAGINIIGTAIDGIGQESGVSVVDISSGAVITAKGSNSVGISSQTYGASTANIRVSDSTVFGGKYGILVDNDNSINATAGSGSPGLSTVTLINSLVTSGSDAIHVNSGARSNITIGKGSRIQGNNDVLFSGDTGSQTALTIDNTHVIGAINNQGSTNVTLQNDASWAGTATGLTSLTTTSRGQWTVMGDSSVGNFANGGTVQLSRGNVTPRNTLTVLGNYVGNDGALLFNSKLTGDSSLTDKLVIKGNASGTTRVSVANAGGTGAQTIDGIEIIHVDGTSTAGAFKQQGRIVAGAYDYMLNKHNNSWYLDSRPASKPIIHFVRPEVGSYIANQAASSMFLTTLRDRAGENRYMNVLNADNSVSSLWLRQVGNHNQFHDSSGQLRTTGNTYVAQLGGDLTQWTSNDHDRFHVGMMAGYGNSHNNTQSTVTGHGSKGSVNGYSVGIYGTWYQNDQNNTGAYVDSQLLYSWFNNHINGDGVSAEKYKSKGLAASVETGYTFALGKSGKQDNPAYYFIEPQAQVTWMGIKSDSVTEAGGTKVNIHGDNNIQTRLGARAFLRGHNRMDNGKDRSFQPFIEINWLHNTKRNGVVMNGVSLEQTGATNIGELKLGVEGQLSRQTSLWGNVGQQLGGKGYSNTAAMVGIKYSF